MHQALLLPWFAPKLSQAVSRLILNIGRRCVLTKGQSVGTSTFFNRVVYVKSGLLAQGLINPGGTTPFMLTLAGPASFGIAGNAIDRLDNLPCRYWAATHCEVLTAMPELLLRLAEVEESLNRELTEHALRRAVSDRLSLMICQAAGPEDRLGVFMVSLLAVSGPGGFSVLNTNHMWLRLPTPPSRKLLAAVLSCRQSDVDSVLRGWIAGGSLRFADGALWMKRSVLLHYLDWMQPFVRMHSQMALAPSAVPSEQVVELDL